MSLKCSAQIVSFVSPAGVPYCPVSLIQTSLLLLNFNLCKDWIVVRRVSTLVIGNHRLDGPNCDRTTHKDPIDPSIGRVRGWPEFSGCTRRAMPLHRNNPCIS